jgi:hypothetical protein
LPVLVPSPCFPAISRRRYGFERISFVESARKPSCLLCDATPDTGPQCHKPVAPKFLMPRATILAGLAGVLERWPHRADALISTTRATHMHVLPVARSCCGSHFTKKPRLRQHSGPDLLTIARVAIDPRGPRDARGGEVGGCNLCFALRLCASVVFVRSGHCLWFRPLLLSTEPSPT